MLLWSAVLFPAGAVAVGWLDPTPAGLEFWVFYVAPLFLAAPLWLRIRLDEGYARLETRGVVDAVVFALSVARFFFDKVFPFSGHTLFLSYTGLTTSSRVYRSCAVLLFLETTWFKLAIWQDTRSWAIGIGIGVAAAIVTRLTARFSASRLVR